MTSLTKIYQICENLKQNESIDISKKFMVDATLNNFNSMMFNGPVRDIDVKEFIKKIEEKYDIEITECYYKENCPYTIHKR